MLVDYYEHHEFGYSKVAEYLTSSASFHKKIATLPRIEKIYYAVYFTGTTFPSRLDGHTFVSLPSLWLTNRYANSQTGKTSHFSCGALVHCSLKPPYCSPKIMYPISNPIKQFKSVRFIHVRINQDMSTSRNFRLILMHPQSFTRLQKLMNYHKKRFRITTTCCRFTGQLHQRSNQTMEQCVCSYLHVSRAKERNSCRHQKQ